MTLMLRHWALLLVMASASGFAQFPLLRSLEVRSGQRRPQIAHVVQDASGLLWAGSDLGVMRTDGERVEAMIRMDGAQVTAMNVLGRDVLVAFSNGVLTSCSSMGCDTLLKDSLLAEHPLRAMAFGADGSICLASYGGGVLFWDSGVVQRLRYSDGLPDEHVNDVAWLEDDRFIVATDQGLAVLSPRGVESVFDGAAGAPDNLVMAVATLPDGSVVAGTDRSGVFQWRPGTNTARSIGTEQITSRVTDIAVEEHRVWVGTEDAGVVVIEMDSVASVYLHPGTTGPITGMWTDREGQVWWCDGSERIHRADPAILYVPEHEGVDLRAVSALCVDGMDRIWFASPEGLFHHPTAFSEGRHLQRMSLQIDPRTPIVSLAATRSGTIWAATFGSGVFAITPSGEVRHHTEQGGLRNMNVLAARAAGDSVWFATLDGACLWDGNGFKDLVGTGGFTFDVLPQGKDQALVATDGQGILRYADGSTESLRSSANTFYSLIADGASGQAWAMGPTAGICKVANGRANCTGAGLPLFKDDVFALAMVRDRVLALGKAGVWAHDPLSGAWIDLSGRIGTTGAEAELNAVARSNDGAVWFACDRGIVRLRLTERHFDNSIPVVITGILINGDPVPVATSVRTSHDRNDLTLRFAGINYPDPGRIRFEYSIGENGNVLRSRDRELAFTGLTPGVHRIRLRAFVEGMDGDAQWTTILITVAPPWWRLPWVIALFVSLALAILVLIIRARERRMRIREGLEQEKVRFQLEALRSQVDPHFLFNSFNTLAALIETDPPSALEHVDELSTFFRSILLVRDKDLIPLEEELELLHRYFGLEKHRFGAAIDLLVRIEEEIDAYRIVPLTLQLLMENALKHNVATVKEPLQVLVTIEAGDVVVRNAIRPRASAARSTGFGLESIIKRYSAISAKPVVVAPGGGEFSVRIPLITAS